jgi:uncharacterized protein YggT (Ycf19 family)
MALCERESGTTEEASQRSVPAKEGRMTIRREDEETADESGRRTAAEDRPITRDDSVVEEQVVYSPAGGWNLARDWVRSLVAVIMVALAVVETLLAFRLGFLLAKANSSNGFVNFIYDISKPLAAPFQGIVTKSGNLEYASLIAMGVYAVAALLLIAALSAITAGPSAAGEKVVTSRTRWGR